jgi:hypothetical protein
MKKMKMIVAIGVIVVLVASIIIPAIAGVDRLVYLDSSCVYEADDLRPRIRMLFSYWGGDGNDVYYFCCIETNTYDEWHEANITSASSMNLYSPYLEYNRTMLPFTYYCDGYAYYD